MNGNLRIFGLISLAGSVLYWFSYDKIFAQASWDGKIIWIVASFLYLFVLADIVHRLSGVPTKPKPRKLIEFGLPRHQDYEKMMKFWDIEIVAFVITGLIYAILFTKDGIFGSTGSFCLFIAVVSAIGFFQRGKKIKGLKKEEIFK